MTTDIKAALTDIAETNCNIIGLTCAAARDYIEQLEGQLSAAMSGWKQNVEELKTQSSAQTAEPVAWMHQYRHTKGGRRYEVADIGEGGPDPEEGFEHCGKHPLTYTHPAKTEQPSLSDATPNDLRDRGLFVAVHNDYMLNGESHTFWLFTDAQGMSYKGEGKTDAEALNQVRALLSAQRQDSDKDALPSAEFVRYEHRFKYDDETSSIKGWSAWEPCKSQADFKDLCVYISWGKPYQLRSIYAAPVDDAQIADIANGAPK